MSYTTVYTQNWAAGNSTFSETPVYFYDGHGSPTASGPDALYPEAYEAQAVRVRTGRGPAGENTLDWWDDPASDYFYDIAGFWARLPSAAAPGSVSIAEGAIEAWYQPNSTSILNLSYSPLLWLNKYASEVTLFKLSIRKNFFTGDVRKLELEYLDGDDPVVTNSHTNAHPLDTWWRYRVEWKEATYTGADPNSDGYLRVYENGSLIYNDAAIALRAVGQVAADRGLVDGYQLGYLGLFGEVTGVQIESTDEATPSIEPPPLNGTVPNCCTSGGNPAVLPDPIGVLPPWVGACVGGGVVDSVADLTDGEDWTIGAAPVAPALWLLEDEGDMVGNLFDESGGNALLLGDES